MWQLKKKSTQHWTISISLLKNVAEIHSMTWHDWLWVCCSGICGKPWLGFLFVWSDLVNAGAAGRWETQKKEPRRFQSHLWWGSWWVWFHLSSCTPVNQWLFPAWFGRDRSPSLGWELMGELWMREGKKRTQENENPAAFPFNQCWGLLLPCDRSLLSETVFLSSFSSRLSWMHSFSLASSSSWRSWKTKTIQS